MDFDTAPDPRGLILALLVVFNVLAALILFTAHRRHPELLALKDAAYRTTALALVSALVGIIWLSDLYDLDLLSADVRLGARFIAMIVISIPSLVFLYNFWQKKF